MKKELKLRSVKVQKPDFVEGTPEVKLGVDISHNNGETTLKLPVSFTKLGQQWSVDIDWDDFPECDSLDDARLTMADWLGRAAETLKENSLDTVDLDGLRWD